MVEDLRVDGITTRIKLFSGALVLNYATVDRLIMDMEANHIQRAVVQQINPPNKNCVEVMDNIVKNETIQRLAKVTVTIYDEDNKKCATMTSTRGE